MISWELWVQSWGDKNGPDREARSIVDAKFVLNPGTLVLNIGITEINWVTWFEREMTFERGDLLALRAMIDVALEHNTEQEDGQNG